MSIQRKRLRNHRSLAEITAHIHKLDNNACAIGELLVKVREEYLNHGEFLPWLASEFAWSERTAYNKIGVYEMVSKFANIANLKLPQSALYALAQEDDKHMPAIIEALRKAGAENKQLSNKDAIKIINGARPEPEKHLDPHNENDARHQQDDEAPDNENDAHHDGDEVEPESDITPNAKPSTKGNAPTNNEVRELYDALHLLKRHAKRQSKLDLETYELSDADGWVIAYWFLDCLQGDEEPVKAGAAE